MVLPWKVTVKGLRLRKQPTRRRRPLYCDLERREDAGHGGRVRPLLQARPSAQRNGGHRRPAEAGQPGLAAAARP